MKKLFLSITLLVVAMGAFAQDEYYLKADPFFMMVRVSAHTFPQ